jgi:hypothetical protein
MAQWTEENVGRAMIDSVSIHIGPIFVGRQRACLHCGTMFDAKEDDKYLSAWRKFWGAGGNVKLCASCDKKNQNQ